MINISDYIEIFKDDYEIYILNNFHNSLTYIDCNNEIQSYMFNNTSDKIEFYQTRLKEYKIVGTSMSRNLQNWFNEVFLKEYK